LAKMPVTQLAKLAAPKSKRAKLAVAKVVQAALLIGTGGLMQFQS